MRAVAVGGKLFVASFRLGGVYGVVAKSGREALKIIQDLARDSEIGLILVSDEYGEDFSGTVRQLSSSLTRPVIYLLPKPGGQHTEVDYRAMLRKILGI